MKIDSFFDAALVTLSNWDELVSIAMERLTVHQHQHSDSVLSSIMWPTLSHDIPLDPWLSTEEQNWIRSILPPESNNDRWIITRCTLPPPPIPDEMDKEESTTDHHLPNQPNDDPNHNSSFERLANVFGQHPQVFFVSLQQCPLDQGPPTVQDGTDGIWLHRVIVGVVEETMLDPTTPSPAPPNTDPVDNDGENEDDNDDTLGDTTTASSILQLLSLPTTTTHSTPTVTTDDTIRLGQFLSRLLRPTLLWWDRQSTAPMAFASYYATHVVLVVDFMVNGNDDDDDDNDDDLGKDRNDKTASALAEFAQVCQTHHFAWQFNVTNDIVCLVVPSTETRVLKTFGINIWADHTIESGNNQQGPLPALFLTHRSFRQGIQRYYLDSPQQKMAQFINDFYESRLQGELSSRANAKPKNNIDDDNDDSWVNLLTRHPNRHGVVEWTTYHVEHYRGRRRMWDASDDTVPHPDHALLLAYAPTCGHCKRLHVIWNRLGRLVQYLNWTDWLQIARIDVTTETFSEYGALILPSIYYYHGGNVTWMKRQRSHETVGGINDPLEIVAWLLDVGVGLDEAQLLDDLLLNAPEEDEEQDGDDDEAVDNVPSSTIEDDLAATTTTSSSTAEARLEESSTHEEVDEYIPEATRLVEETEEI